MQFAASEADRLGLELCMHNCPGWSSSGGPWIKPEFAMQTVVFSETPVHGPTAFAAALAQPPTKNDFYRDIAVLAYPTPTDGTRIGDLRPKAGYDYAYGQQPQLASVAPGAVVRRDAIVDLTSRLDHDGKLAWDVPAGDWTIVRIGHTPTGAVNAPAPASGRGLECDKLSRAGLDAHWAGIMGPVIKQLGPLAGKTLNNCLIDSYEVGGQNWTENFRAEFTKRRGYDPLPYLPTLSGQVIDSGEISERFLWDMRRTIADLFADNYYTYFAELCHQNGLRASIEPYDGPFECLLAGRDADIPMGEFWIGGGETDSVKLAASVAHIYGRRIVGAESFTAEPRAGKWQNYPGSLKSIGDLMYCAGINRYIIHRYAHQPWLDQFPGMTMGQWGTHFERTTTWWQHGGPEWVQYLARCQYLLQQGSFVADVCFFTGEAAPNGAPHDMALKAKGYDYDAANADVLMRAHVANGRLNLADGMSYRLLVLPDTTFVRPEMLQKIAELVRSGATVIGPKPTQSPSLAGYPACDERVRKLADEVWGDCDGAAVQEHRFGQGRVVWGKSVEATLDALKVAPDCRFAGSSGAPKMAWIHRRIDGTDAYFVSNQRARNELVECSFRVTGKTPELWNAETGAIAEAPLWREENGRTVVTVPFEPNGSTFVVFRGGSSEAHLVALKSSDFSGAAMPAMSKIEIRRAAYEAVDGTGGVDVTAKVAALVAAGETSIPASNGLFGDPTYNHVKRLRVEYTIDGAAKTGSADENATLELIAAAAGPVGLPDYWVERGASGKTLLTAMRAGRYEFTASNAHGSSDIQSVPAAIELTGRWTLRFPPNWGAPPQVSLDQLASWTENSDPGVRYFSGTVEYETTFDVAPELLGDAKALFLDLGQVKNIASVTLNGTSLPTLWKPPYTADISRIAHAGSNTLKVRVTNLWPNRLIGDEQLPEDVEWNGIVLKRWPEWLASGTPRPTKRLTFTTWHHWRRDSQLLESGLIGPVMLRPAVRVPLGL